MWKNFKPMKKTLKFCQFDEDGDDGHCCSSCGWINTKRALTVINSGVPLEKMRPNLFSVGGDLLISFDNQAKGSGENFT